MWMYIERQQGERMFPKLVNNMGYTNAGVQFRFPLLKIS